MKAAVLTDILNKEATEGRSLGSHLKAILRQVKEGRFDNQENIDFEKISAILKGAQFEFVKSHVEPLDFQSDKYLGKAVLSAQEKLTKNTFPNTLVDDLNTTIETLFALGKGVSNLERMKLSQALFKIADDPSFIEVRFFGKVITLNSDYYVIWTRLRELNSVQGETIHTVAFFVSNDLDSWTKLTEITPKTVRESRKIKTLFTGDLSTKLPNGLTEEQHLHANLLRILYSCCAAPADYYTLNSDSENMIERNADCKFSSESLAELTGWVHRFPNILKLGDSYNKYANEPEIMQRIEASEPSRKRLTPLSEDGTAWSVTITKSPFSFTSSIDTTAQKRTKVTSVTNETWPGAINFHSELTNTFSFFYSGFGIKSTKSQSLISSSVSKVNPDILKIGIRDYKEPNPDEDQEVLETDSEPERNSVDEKE